MNKTKEGRKKRPPSMSKCVREADANLGLGAVSLVNKRLTSLEGLGVQKGLVKIYLQNNYLENFAFLDSQPHLKELYVQDNMITSFKGLQIQPRLEIFAISGNPICDEKLCRVMALLAIGPSLRRIDNELITQIERMTASRMSPKATQAVRLGAILDYKQRSEEELDEIIQQLTAPTSTTPTQSNGTPTPSYMPPSILRNPDDPRIEIVWRNRNSLNKSRDEDDEQEELILRTLKEIEEADLMEGMPYNEAAIALALGTSNISDIPYAETSGNGTEEYGGGSALNHTDSFASENGNHENSFEQGHNREEGLTKSPSKSNKQSSAATSSLSFSTSSPGPATQTLRSDDEERYKEEIDQLKEEIRQLKRSLIDEKKAKLEMRALLRQEHASRQKEEDILKQSLAKTEASLQEEVEKSNNLAFHLNEMNERCESLSSEVAQLEEANDVLYQEKLELMEMSTQNLLAEKLQRKIIEDRLERASTPVGGTRGGPTASPAKLGETEFISARDMCRIDTIQFYTAIRKDTQNISACISFHDDGITMMNTDTSQAMELPLKERGSLRLVKDSDTLLTIFGNNHHVVLNDKRIDLIATLISHWMKFKAV